MPGQVLRHDLFVCVCVCMWVGWVPARPHHHAHSARLRDRAWKLSRGTRCLAAALPLPFPKSSLEAPMTTPPSSQVGLAEWPGGSKAARWHRGPQTAGDAAPQGPEHIWFSFECPNVITFSATQRKSLVRCGFPHFPSRLRNQSLSFHQPPCHWCVLLSKRPRPHSALFSRADGRGPGDTQSHCPTYPPERTDS